MFDIHSSILFLTASKAEMGDTEYTERCVFAKKVADYLAENGAHSPGFELVAEGANAGMAHDLKLMMMYFERDQFDSAVKHFAEHSVEFTDVIINTIDGVMAELALAIAEGVLEAHAEAAEDDSEKN